ncbi:hypothetical protein LTR56_017726 [Elasticomyces elasticus]|nr:hypothetical protein LTR56_017726 [Elasticomyces elasticus]KAK3637738.1 hypothetical protein LTR22_018139 [Elasticomyces elasticus]KAK4915364.1 hypothetical protein LTR49_016495 [Elasticomyces elasticus]KAK5752270.1 hypothetical protein LTS12_017664 [Elasticomyces elasticus]
MTSNYFAGSNSGGSSQIGRVDVRGSFNLYQQGSSHDGQNILDACLQSLNFRGMYDELDGKVWVQGTGDWIFSHNQYTNWHDSNGTLKITGRAGCGKSVLMSHIIAHERDLKVPGEVGLVLSFRFNYAGDELRRSECGMLRTLLHQALAMDNDLLANFLESSQYVERCRTRGNPGTGWDWTTSELRDQIHRVITSAMSKQHAVRIFVDGLDESTEDAARSLGSIVQSVSTTQLGAVGLCLASRPQAISELLHDFHINLEQENRHDMELYLNHHFTPAAHCTDLTTVRDCLINQSGTVFQWLTWMCPRVLKLAKCGEEPDYIMNKIKGYPKELKEVYTQQLELIHLDDVPEALCIFEWLTIRPCVMSVNELRHAVCLEDGVVPETVDDFKHSIHWSSAPHTFAARVNRLTKDLIRLVTEEMDQPASNHGVVRGAEDTTTKVLHFDHHSVHQFMLESGLQILQSKIRPAGQNPLSLTDLQVMLGLRCLAFLMCKEVIAFREGGMVDREEHMRCHKEVRRMNRNHVLRTQYRVPEPAFTSYAILNWAEYFQLMTGYFDPLELCHRINTMDWAHVAALHDIIMCGHCFGQYSDTTALHVLACRGLKDLILLVWMYTPGVGETWVLDGHGYDLPTRQALLARSTQQLGARDASGHIPLAEAASRGCVEVVKLFLEYGAQPWPLTNDAETPLHLAAKVGSASTVELLLECEGADVDAKNRFGWTSLMLAVFSGSVATVRPLLKRSKLGPHCEGVAVEIDDLPGIRYTPLLAVMVRSNREEMRDLLLGSDKIDRDMRVDRYDSLSTFLDTPKLPGGAPSLRFYKLMNAEGETPFLVASEVGDLEVMILLMQYGIGDIQARDNHDMTPLWRAVTRRHTVIVKLLLVFGAYHPDAVAENTEMFVHAAGRGNCDVVKLLSTQIPNLDPLRLDSRGISALGWALFLHEFRPPGFIEPPPGFWSERSSTLRYLCKYYLAQANPNKPGLGYGIGMEIAALDRKLDTSLRSTMAINKSEEAKLKALVAMGGNGPTVN